MSKQFDLVIKNVRVVRPTKTSVDCLDIAIKDGKISRLAPDVPPSTRSGLLRFARSDTVPHDPIGA